MESPEVLLTGLDRFSDVLATVPDDGWDRRSPCSDWTVRGLVGHVLQVTDSAVTVLGGEEYSWSDAGDPVDRAGDDPVSAFAANADAVRRALDVADLDQVATTPMGEMTIAMRLSFPAMDLHVHAWDVSRSLDQPIELDQAFIDFAHEVVDPVPDSFKRGGGVFGPEVAPPPDATPTEAFVAWTGRRPR